MSDNEQKGLVPAQGTQMQSIGDIDLQEQFQFAEKPITLGLTEAWCLNNHIMPFGKGAKRLANALGLEYLMPERIFIDGHWHSNPHVVFRAGKAIGIHIVKHGIAITRNEIRYLQPVLDYIDIDSVIAAMALQTQKKLQGISADAAKNCTRPAFNTLSASYTKPGDPDWFFVPTLDNETGIAFNLNEKGDAGTVINKLISDINGTRRYPLRKIDTSTDRRIFEKMFPEVLTSYNFKDSKVSGYKVPKVTFFVDAPTLRPVARALIIEFGIALRDNDSDARERKFAAITKALGGTVPVRQLEPVRMDAKDIIEGEYEEGGAEENNPELKPCPAKMTSKEFTKYYTSEFRNLTARQKGVVLKFSGFDNWDAYKLNKDNWKRIYEYFMEVAGIAPAQDETGEITPADIRKEMVAYLVDNDGKAGDLGPIFTKFEIDIESDFNLIPDETVQKIYNAWLNAQAEEEG